MELVITSKRDLRELIDESVRGAVKFDRPDPGNALAPPKEWLTNREAQVFFGLSKSTLQRYRNSGKLPYSKTGGCVYYRRIDVRQLLEANLRGRSLESKPGCKDGGRRG